MEFKYFNKNQLERYIHSDQFWKADYIPISTHRALSQIKNPRAKNEDILLISAEENGKLIGYIGILPDDIVQENKSAIHFGWFSCLWVDPVLRGRSIGKQLVNRALEAWNDHICITDYTDEANILYNKTNKFQHDNLNEGIRIYQRFDTAFILSSKHNFFRQIKGILKLSDRILNYIADKRYLFYRSDSDKHNFFEVNQIDQGLSDWILDKNTKNKFRRTQLELNWIREYPWLLMKPENSESKKYYFSSISQYFKNHLVVQKDSNGEYSDVLMLSIRNSHLKVLYGHLTNPQSTFSFLRQFIIQNRISTISIFHPELVLQMKKQFVFCLYKKPISKRFRISMDLWPFLKDYLKEIQCGDGDSCFT